jgi:hypothetical protein
MKTGNYWIYEVYRISPNGDEVLTGGIDSIYVTKDTIINENKYFETNHNTLGDYSPNFNYFRDSSGFLVNHWGSKIFSYLPETDTLYSFFTFSPDTLAKITIHMIEKNQMRTISTGTYNTYNRRTTFEFYPPYNSRFTHRYQNIIFAEGLGIISETLPIFIQDTNTYERRLIRYNVSEN